MGLFKIDGVIVNSDFIESATPSCFHMTSGNTLVIGSGFCLSELLEKEKELREMKKRLHALPFWWKNYIPVGGRGFSGDGPYVMHNAMVDTGITPMIGQVLKMGEKACLKIPKVGKKTLEGVMEDIRKIDYDLFRQKNISAFNPDSISGDDYDFIKNMMSGYNLNQYKMFKSII